MTARKRSPLYQWEREMIDSFYDYQWHLILDPLYEKFQRWRAGEVSRYELNEAIHKTHKACQQVYSLFAIKRDFLVSAIQFNEDWFSGWEKYHPRPKDLFRRTFEIKRPVRLTQGQPESSRLSM
jgi:hypothetical protein